MSKETLPQNTELERLAAGLGQAFIQRRDLYARQLSDGSYVCIRKALKPYHLVAHLQGKITLGAYVLDRESRARYVAFDADDDDQMERLANMSSRLAARNVPSYLESSRRGGHLWLFFSKPIPGKDARRFGQGLARICKLADIELFPKQDRLENGPGSLIRLPFGVHLKTGERYDFITTDFQPLAASLVDQVQMLCAPETVPEAALEAMLTQTSSRSETAISRGVEEPEQPLSERIKNTISVYDFVGQYVELSPGGRGLCPFHDDRHASFAVNTDENYWHCFAGCGGGSIIDFWMKLKDCNFRDAVRELAGMLLA